MTSIVLKDKNVNFAIMEGNCVAGKVLDSLFNELSEKFTDLLHVLRSALAFRHGFSWGAAIGRGTQLGLGAKPGGGHCGIPRLCRNFQSAIFHVPFGRLRY